MFHRSNARHATPKRKRLSHRKKFLLALVLPPLLIGGSAFAYFALDQGVSHVDVATPPNFYISIDQPTGTALSPGVGSENILFAVVNQQNYAQTVNNETYALTTDAAGGVYDTVSNAFVDTCQANWFTVTGTPGPGITFPTTLQVGGAIYTGSITVTMPANLTTNQSACEGLEPQVSVTVS